MQEIIVITIFDKTRIVIFFVHFKYAGIMILIANKLLDINKIFEAYTAKLIIPFVVVNKEKILSENEYKITEKIISKIVQ